MGFISALTEQFDRQKALEQARQEAEAQQRLIQSNYQTLGQIAPIVPTNEAERINLERSGYIPSEAGYITPERQMMQNEREYRDYKAQQNVDAYQNKLQNPLFNIGDTLVDVANNTVGLPLKLLSGGQNPFGDPSQTAKNKFQQSLADTQALHAVNQQHYRQQRDARNKTFSESMKGERIGISDITPEDYTPESLDLFRRTNKFSDLTSKAKTGGFNNASTLRKEFIKLSAPFIKQNAAMGRIEAAAKEPSAAGDLALIFNYMKILDEGSTVREGEFANAQNSAGVPQRIIAQYNALLTGERLSDTQRSDFLNRARMLFQEADKQHEVSVTNYRDLAIRNNIDPDNVLINFRTYQDQSQPPKGFVLMEDANGNQAYVDPNTNEIWDGK